MSLELFSQHTKWKEEKGNESKQEIPFQLLQELWVHLVLTAWQVKKQVSPNYLYPLCLPTLDTKAWIGFYGYLQHIWRQTDRRNIYI